MQIFPSVSKDAERIFRSEKDKVIKQFENNMTTKSAEYFRNVKCENVEDKSEMTRNTIRTLETKLEK
jgi:hypothetical protein